MPKSFGIIAVALTFVPVLPLQAASAVGVLPDQSIGLWAADAKRPANDTTFKPSVVTAPDGNAAIVYSSDGVYLHDGNKTTTLQEVNEPPVLSEVLWAPDSRAFVITASDGGLVGTWRAHFYSIDADGRAIARDITSLISKVTKPFALCSENEEVNFGATGWLRDSSELLVIAQVPPHSSCANMGALIGFRIDVKTWKLQQVIGESTLRSKFAGFLGSRLKLRGRA